MSGSFHYHFIEADGTIDAVALRFHTTRQLIFAATADSSPFEGKAETDQSTAQSWRPPFNSLVCVPTPKDELSAGCSWREIPSGPTRVQKTFKELIESLAESSGGPALGFANTPLECGLIYHDWRNRDYREAATMRLKSAQPGTAPAVSGTNTGPCEASWDEADLAPEDKVYLPLEQIHATFFPVAPSDETQPEASVATIDLTATALDALQKRLHAIDLACYNLKALRKRAQQIQADSSRDVRTLLMARALVQLVVKRYAADAQTQDDSGKNRVVRKLDHLLVDGDSQRKALLVEIDKLIPTATKALLDGPQRTVDPKLCGRWDAVSDYLVSLLRDPQTLGFLDTLLPTHGDLPLLKDGIAGVTLLDAVCETVSHAVFWLADGVDTDDAKALLDEALNAIGSGQPRAAGASKSVVDYVAALAYAKEGHPAYGKTAPIAVASVILHVCAAGALADASGSAPAARAAKAQGLVAKYGPYVETLLMNKVANRFDGVENVSELATYVDLTGHLYTLEHPTSGLGAIPKGAFAVKDFVSAGKALTEATLAARLMRAEASPGLASTARALKAAGPGKVAEVYRQIRVLENPKLQFKSLPQQFESLRRVFAFAGFLSSRVPSAADDGSDSDETELTHLTKGLHSTASNTDSSFEMLAELGVLKARQALVVKAVIGRVSLLLGAVADGEDAVKAFREDDYLEGAAHTLMAAGEIVMLFGPETGGVALLIGSALYAAGVICDVAKSIMTSNSETLFVHNIDALLNGNAGHFPDLRARISGLRDMVRGKTSFVALPSFNKWDLQAYEDDLRAAGFTIADFAS